MWWLWPACFLMLATGWVWVLMTKEMNWLCIGLGFITGLLLTCWGVETFPGPYKSSPKK